MKSSLFALVLFFTVSAHASIREQIAYHLGTGSHRTAVCHVNVGSDSSRPGSISVSILDLEHDSSMTFTSNESDSLQYVIHDRSVNGTMDVMIRTRVRAGELYTEVKRLEIDNGDVKISLLKRGISGRMNTLKTMSCRL